MANTERLARDAVFNLELFKNHLSTYRKFSTGRCNVNPTQPDEKYDRWVEMEARRLFLQLLPVEQGCYPTNFLILNQQVTDIIWKKINEGIGPNPIGLSGAFRLNDVLKFDVYAPGLEVRFSWEFLVWLDEFARMHGCFLRD